MEERQDDAAIAALEPTPAAPAQTGAAPKSIEATTARKSSSSSSNDKGLIAVSDEVTEAPALFTTTAAPNSSSKVVVSQQQAALEAALGFWRRVDLGGGAQRAALEKQGLELRAAKDATLQNRKRLAEATKEFKRKGDAERLAGFDALLGDYQQAIDALTRRAKGADAAFLGLRQQEWVAGDAPDPAPLLAAALQDRRRAAALEVEVQRLQGEVAEYEQELGSVRNQDITLRRLEETVRGYEEGQAERLEEALAAARGEIESLAAARVQEAEERACRSDARAAAAEAAADGARGAAAAAQARLFEAEAGGAAARAAGAAEMALLVGERERWAAEAAAAKREVEALRARVEAAAGAASGPAGPGAGGGAGAGGSKEELEEMAAALAAARQRLLRKEEAWAEEAAAMRASVSGLEGQLAVETEARVAAEAALAARPSVEEVEGLKGQVRLLQRLEFNAVEEGEEEEVSAGEGEGQGLPSVERLLLGRIRRMETEAVAGRRRVAEAEAARGQMEDALTAAEARAGEQAVLIAKLEDDLARTTNATTSTSSSSATSAPPPPPQQQGQPGAVVGVRQQEAAAGKEEQEGVDMAQLLLSAAASTPSSSSATTQPLPPHDGEGGSHNLVSILQAQRDRYKARVRAMEGEVEAAGAAAARERAGAEAARRDNVALYAKIRYLQAYGGSGGAAERQQARAAPRLAVLPSEGPASVMEAGGAWAAPNSAAAEARYRALYEEQMNPFAAFSRAERARRYQSLPLPEKIAHAVARLFLGSKPARAFFLGYAGALHLLVFVTMYVATHHGEGACHSTPTGLPHPAVAAAAAQAAAGDVGSG